MKQLSTWLILISFGLYSCDSKEKVNNKHETLYNSVSDSLVKYKNEIIENIGPDDTLFVDYMKLDYISFKSKYKFSDFEMDDLAGTFTVSYQIGRTFREMDINISDFDEIDSTVIENQEQREEKYSFESDGLNLKQKQSDEDEELKILMEAYDSDQGNK